MRSSNHSSSKASKVGLRTAPRQAGLESDVPGPLGRDGRVRLWCDRGGDGNRRAGKTAGVLAISVSRGSSWDGGGAKMVFTEDLLIQRNMQGAG